MPDLPLHTLASLIASFAMCFAAIIAGRAL